MSERRSELAGQPIVHIIHSGGFYGAERMLLDHCQSTHGRHRVVFIDAPASLIQRFVEAGIPAVSCTGLRALRAHLRGEPGLLNGHNFKAQVFAWLCAMSLGLPMVMTQHGFTPRSAKQKLYTRLSLLLCRSATVRRVACVAQSIARLHTEAGVSPAKLQVIPNGLPDAPPGPPRPLHEGALLVGFVGRLSQEKGPDFFLDALISLCLQRPELTAVMLGDGPLTAELEARIEGAGLQQRIVLPGYQTDMGAWMQRLDVLVISSRTEGTPMILLEAMQAGTPVVAFAVGGIPDVITHGQDGLLAAPEDSAGLADAVAKLLDDPVFRQRLSAQAMLTQRSSYHLPALAANWQAFYSAAAQGVPA